MAKAKKTKLVKPLRHVVLPLPTMPRVLRFLRDWCWAFWNRGWWNKMIVIISLLVALSFATMYGIARWYMWTQRDRPVLMGTTFISDYAAHFGLDPKETMEAILTDFEIDHLRLVSYWDRIEHTQGSYDFRELDWQFEKANKHGAKVSLAIGLRQPRWPECHMPKWAESQPKEVWSAQLKAFMSAVITRYKDNPALESYQLENEYFLKVFGICPDHSRDRLIDEYHFVKGLDPDHAVIVSRSNNAIGTPINEPTPDVYGVSVYKRVWVPIVGRYVEYPFPAWFYAFLAGTEKIIKGRETMVHELQAEPWGPRGQGIKDISLEEQDKSLSAERLHGRFEYGRATGMKHLDLWGAEYWYFRKVKLNEPSVWNAARDEFSLTVRENEEMMAKKNK